MAVYLDYRWGSVSPSCPIFPLPALEGGNGSVFIFHSVYAYYISFLNYFFCVFDGRAKKRSRRVKCRNDRSIGSLFSKETWEKLTWLLYKKFWDWLEWIYFSYPEIQSFIFTPDLFLHATFRKILVSFTLARSNVTYSQLLETGKEQGDLIPVVVLTVDEDFFGRKHKICSFFVS